MYYLYAIISKNKNYIYVGISDDYNRRINQHNKGYNKTTRPYRPFEKLTIQKFITRAEAKKREKYLKSGCGKEDLKSLLK
ncbi:MAG: GIY-YIG nuclease superfamily protein [Parcubacteria group bacterium ADurb.Bin316]|nr:MAG: GIY-YIG nuclease superfamily protein [Parcubacteria group bacterium ADurb.Bin316]HOZ55856.1 GIY-YIG nuclease family protein [bacterium]